MMDNISEQINSIINNLSEKLGVAAEKLYPILIKQAFVEGIIGIIFILIGLILFISPLIEFKILTKKDKENSCIAEDWDYDEWTIFCVINAFVVIAGLLIIILNISGTITAFANPEWHALNAILDKIKER